MGNVIPAPSRSPAAKGKGYVLGLITIMYRAMGQLDRFARALEDLGELSVLPVFVVNAQTSEEIEVIRARFPAARILEPGANLGTAAAWNLGIRALLDERCEFIGVLNIDVRPCEGCLEKMLEVLSSDPTIGACQPLLLDCDDTNLVEMFGGSLNAADGSAEHDYRGSREPDCLPSIREAGYLDGGTMMIPARVLRQVGGFDESLFMYAEDSDLCIRIRRAGYRLVAIRDARALHFHRKNWGKLPAPHQLYYETRNRFHLVRKHGGRAALVSLAARMLVTFPRRQFYYVRRGKWALAHAYLSGYFDGLANRVGKQGWVE